MGCPTWKSPGKSLGPLGYPQGHYFSPEGSKWSIGEKQSKNKHDELTDFATLSLKPEITGTHSAGFWVGTHSHIITVARVTSLSYYRAGRTRPAIGADTLHTGRCTRCHADSYINSRKEFPWQTNTNGGIHKNMVLWHMNARLQWGGDSYL